MRVLVIGSGGREHGIIWKLKQNNKELEIFCAPGNAGIGQMAKTVPIPATDIEKLLEFAKNEKIDLTVVGMEDPLVLGVVDEFEKSGMRIFGPRKNAAIIEGSKAFSKEFMKKYHIPTADYETFDDYQTCLSYVKNHEYPLVIKADGLAMGKGVLICNCLAEAEAGLIEIMVEKKFGDVGNRVVIEQFLTGNEVSVLAFCDGSHIAPMVSAQDHKRALDGDQGLNTGGMGTFSPSKYYTDQVAVECMEKIFMPTVTGLVKEGRPFIGIIYFGLILTEHGPKIIEYNCRFGDPETQVVLTRLKTNLLEIFEACIDGGLDKTRIEWEDNASACVIVASGGYPEAYEVGYEITGLDRIAGKENTMVFHAGSKYDGEKIVTAGGRVLGVTGVGNNLDEAIRLAYEGVEMVKFEGMHYRKDIGVK